MNARQFDALLTAADDGVDFDGLRARREASGFAFETPHVSRTGLSESAFHEAAVADPWYVSNWFYWTRVIDAPRRRAFLRWVEGADDRSVPERYEALADGTGREWGELRLTATLGGDGRRRYHVRHRDDAGADAADLDVYPGARDLREVVTYDETGRYRPLKTAPSLRSGWAVTDLDGAGLVEVVETVYPATVANWYREREGDLDVTHWDETAARQTGIYDIVDELPAEAVEWIAETCCVDEECLKRRVWQKNGEEPLDADPGDGVFPCREPCSLVVAAARKWTTLEREASRTYEFELTPSEKEQVEAIIDAVADGRIDEIREADVYEGANRYRTRFLRAKRFDEDGNLSGTPTERAAHDGHDDGDVDADHDDGDVDADQDEG